MNPRSGPTKTQEMVRGALGPTGALLLAVALFWWLIAAPAWWILALLAGLGGLAAGVWAWIERARLAVVLRGRAARYGTNTVVLSLVVLGLLVVVNDFGIQFNHRFDWTSAKLYTLSPQTVRVLKNLHEDLHAMAFFGEQNQAREHAADLLGEYAAQSPHFRFSRAADLIDPERNPVMAKRYGIREDGTIVIEGPNQQHKVMKVTEEEITNAVVKASRSEKKVICFLEGHGEGAPDDQGDNGYGKAGRALESEGYGTRKVLLVEEGKVPVDCKVLVVAGPQHALLPKEVEVLRGYADGGGRVMVEIDPAVRNGAVKTGLEDWIRSLGAEVGRNVVVDQLSRLFGGDPVIPMAASYGDHDITKDLKKDQGVLATIFPLARTITPLATVPTGYQVVSLVKTSPGSFAVPQDRVVNGKIRPDPKHDTPGPLSLAVAIATAPAKTPTGQETHEPRAVVFGNSAFASNRYFDFMGNGDLFLNSVSWLAQERDLISIRPKERGMSLLHLDPEQGRALFYLYVILLPGVVLVTGLMVWWKRRRL